MLADATLAAEATALAGRIAGPDASEARRAAALRIAETQVDVLRVRRVRGEIMAAWSGEDDVTARPMRLDRYERRALSRRRLAIHDFDAVGCIETCSSKLRSCATFFQIWQNKFDVS